MISFPLLGRVSVQGYDLYPGPGGEGGLDVGFEAGVTLVVGANGLGKSTLVNLLYRVMVGPCELSGYGPVLGSGQLELRQLRTDELRTFAARVSDGAADAVAIVEYRMGTTTLTVTRDLRSLALTGLSINGDSTDASERDVPTGRQGRSGFQRVP